MAELFDHIIIGGGPAGYEAAAIAASRGEKVALIERDHLGGTCLNRGCIPTKSFCSSAETAHAISTADAFGLRVHAPAGESAFSVDMPAIVGRKNAIVEQLRQGVAMAVQKAEVIHADARFTAPKTIEAGGRELTAPNILIATGSEPAILPIPGAHLALISTELLDITVLPASITIIGGGVIGMEFASIFNGLGTDVTVVEYAREILPPFDKDIAKRLRTTLKQRGITFCTGAEVTAIEQAEGVMKRVVFNEKGKQKTVESEIVLMAVGRKAVVPQGAAEVGYAIGRRGFEVDGAFRTNIDGVRAVGDCNGICQLAHAASAQARVAMGENVDMSVIPSAVFTMPECAMVGRTEEQCLAAGIDITTGKAFFRANGKANAMGHTDGMVKLIINNSTHLIEGCHICGPHASDLIAEAALAMSSRLPAEALAACIHAHPTLSEALLSALPQLPS